MEIYKHDEFFNKNIKHLLLAEGGSKITNDSADAGGLTKYGIADNADGVKDGKTDVDGDGIAETKIENLTEEDAIRIYRRNYYEILYPQYLKSEELILNLFDFGVNSGPVRAIKTLQKVIGSIEDGKMGPNTAKLANDYKGNIVGAYKIARKDFYNDITESSINNYKKTNPNATEKDLMTHTNKRYINGWKNRVDNLKLA